MRWSRPLSLVAVVAILAAVLGATLTLARETLGLAGGDATSVAPATVTVLLLVVAVLVAVLVGLRGGQTASNPYW